MTSDLGPGARLGPYAIIGEIGRGGVGRILKARHVGLDRVVALKLLADEVASDPVTRERFTKEARAAARLNHPSIVQVYDFGTLDGRPYLALEYVDGAPLSETVELYGPLGEKAALGIVRQVASALAVAHEAGIVHRDIKPDNVMVTAGGAVKLVDLGLAKLYRDDPHVTSPGFVTGTPRYMSPEQIEGAEDLDGRTDIYSLGVTLYYLLTGRPAFEGSPGAILSAHLAPARPDPRDHVPGLSEGTRRLVLRMFARVREERVRDARLLVQELDALLSAPAGHAGLPSPLPETALLAAERVLVPVVGPVSRVLVRRAARASGSWPGLVERLCEEVPEGPDRLRARAALAALAGDGGES